MSRTLTASNVDELYARLAEAEDGDTISLAGGDYGSVNLPLKGNDTIASNVTITSADIDDPAVFTGMKVSGLSDLTLDGLVFDYQFAPGDEVWGNAFTFTNVENLTVSNSVFDGDLASGVSPEEDGFGYGIGVVIRGADGVNFENNEMFDFWKGIKVLDSKDVSLVGNDLHSLRMDGINFAEIEGLLIEDNHIHDFNRTTLHWDHADMIQGWTVGTDTPSTDIVIRGNTLDIGEGDFTHSIFMSNHLVGTGQAGEEMYFQNVTIEDNLIVNGHTHGIFVGASNGVDISGNTVVHSDGSAPDGVDAPVEIPRIVISPLSLDVSITDNITAEISDIPEGRTDWTVSGNVLVQDQDVTAPNHYNDVFVSSTIGEDFIPQASGPAGHLGLATPDGLQVRFHTTEIDENSAARTFDASGSILNQDVLPEGTQFIWHFSDGTQAEGVRVNHVFPDAGIFGVTLTAILPDGMTSQAGQRVAVSDPELISFTAGGPLEVHTQGLTETLLAPQQVSPDGIVVDSADNSPALSIERHALSGLFDADSFDISMGVTLEEAGNGTLFRLGRDINATVQSDGMLAISIATTQTDEPIILQTRGINLLDNKDHDISLRLADGQLGIWIDDVLADSAPMTGHLTNSGDHDLWLGTSWGSSVTGVFDSLSVNVDEDTFLPDLTAPPVTVTPEPAPEPEVLVISPEPEVSFSSPKNDEPVTPPTPEVTPPASEGTLTAHFDIPDTPPVSVYSSDDTASGTWTPVLDFDSEHGIMSLQDNGGRIACSTGDMSELGLKLGGEGLSANISRGYVDTLTESDGFRLALTMRSEDEGSSGQLINLSGSVSVYVNDSGNLTVRVNTQDTGVQRYHTEGVDVSDGTSKDIALTYVDQHLEVTIDAVPVINVDLPSPMHLGNSKGLLLGNTWGHENFDGVLEDMTVSTLAETNLVADLRPDNDPFQTLPDDGFTYGM